MKHKNSLVPVLCPGTLAPAALLPNKCGAEHHGQAFRIPNWLVVKTYYDSG